MSAKISVMPVFKLSDETLLVPAPGGVISLPPGTSPDEAIRIGRLTASMRGVWEDHLQVCREVPEKACNPPEPEALFGAGFDGRFHEIVQYRTWISRLGDGRYLVYFDEGNGWWYPLLMLPPEIPADKAVTIAKGAVTEDAFLLVDVINRDVDNAPTLLAVPWDDLHLALCDAARGWGIIEREGCTSVAWPDGVAVWLASFPDCLVGEEEGRRLAEHGWAVAFPCFPEDLGKDEAKVDCPEVVIARGGIFWKGNWGDIRVETPMLWLERVGKDRGGLRSL